MDVKQVAEAFTTLLRTGRFEEAEQFWAEDVVSVEAQEGEMAVLKGRAAVHGKGVWWTENHEIHRFESHGPYVNGEQFCVRFEIEVTRKASGERVAMDEVGLYTLRDGKIVEERFFY